MEPFVQRIVELQCIGDNKLLNLRKIQLIANYSFVNFSCNYHKNRIHPMLSQFLMNQARSTHNGHHLPIAIQIWPYFSNIYAKGLCSTSSFWCMFSCIRTYIIVKTKIVLLFSCEFSFSRKNLRNIFRKNENSHGKCNAFFFFRTKN